jgi:hypothetical protein
MNDKEHKRANPLLTPPFRLYRLSGGMKLIMDAEKDCLLSGAVPGDDLRFKLGSNKVGSSLFGNPNLRVFASSTCRDDTELNDPISETFALSVVGPDRTSLNVSQARYWSGVANACRLNGRLVEEAQFRRLVTHIRRSTRRFEKLHLSYSYTLERYQQTQVERRHFVKSKFSNDIGYEFCSLLDDLYGLRDAVNDLIFRVALNGTGPFRTKKLINGLKNAPKTELFKLVSHSMFDDSGDLLLLKMSTYRSVAMHCMGTTNPVIGNAISFSDEDTNLGPFRRMFFPLYDDLSKLKEIEEETPKGFAFDAGEEEFTRFSNLENHLDALEFGFDCLVRLLTISFLLSVETKLESRDFEITDEDILDQQIL